MERYKEYKDSGVQWIGEIPRHWNCVQFRGIFSITKRIAGRTGFDVLAVTQKGIKVKDVESNEGQIAADYSKYQIVEPGDFAMNHMDLITGFIGISHQYGVTSPDYRVFKNNSSLADSKYYLYIFEFCYKQQIFYGLGHGVSNKGRWRLPAPIQNRFEIPLPPLAEQEKIVSYLEGKTSKIDAYVEEKEKEIQLLQELKQKTIVDAVTKGLNSDVKMKESGISWIGMIPEHWEVSKMKRIFSEAKEKTTTEDGTLLSLSQYTGITLKDEAKKVGMFEAESTIGYNVVHPGQFVMNIMLAWNGSYAVSEYEGIISPSYCVFNFNEECEKKYFHYLLRLPSYAGAFKTMSKGIIESRLRLYPIYFFTFKTIIPPLDEQRAIIAYIGEKCKKIDSLVSELQAEIDNMKEYKQRLIADCVTGQINVQNNPNNPNYE